MPHLSPMQWTFALMLMWTFLLLISATYWWYQPSSFYSSKSSKSVLYSSKWMWL